MSFVVKNANEYAEEIVKNALEEGENPEEIARGYAYLAKEIMDIWRKHDTAR